MRRIRASATLAVALVLGACAAPAPSFAPSSTPASTLGAAAPTPTTGSTPSAKPDLLLVAVGDSIPFNSPGDCASCDGFVDRYAAALARATGKTVGVRNLSEHNNNTVQRLVGELDHDQVRIDALAAADAIIVGIAHNDVPMNRDDDSCDGRSSESPDWSKYTDKCIATELARFRPLYEAAYMKVAALRSGKPTILRTINRYNDWNGWPGHDLSAAGLKVTVKVIAAWNAMICKAAEAGGFLCADISAEFNGSDGRTPSDGLLGGDYTHPSDQGNAVIAGALVQLGFAPLQ